MTLIPPNPNSTQPPEVPPGFPPPLLPEHSPASLLFGLLAEFADAQALVLAAQRTRDAGYTATDAYTPYPVESLSDALAMPSPIRVSAFFLAGAIIGGCSAYFLQWYAAVVDYPWVIGGKPFNSWPMFIPITFELTVLGAGVVGLSGLLWLNRLPMPYHPLFKVHEFDRASQDAFFLLIEARDPRFDPQQTRRFLQSLGPKEVVDVAP